MNQRDQNRGGRGGRYGSMRGEEGRYGDDRERDEQEREHRSWTERLASGYRDTFNPEPQWLREDRERAEGRDYERDPHGRGGTYAGTQREAGYDNAYGGSQRDVESFHPADERGWSAREERQGFSAGARRNRPFAERERYRGALWRDQSWRNEPEQGAPRGGSSFHDLSTGYEPAHWTDDDFNRSGYGGFRVGTGMGLASDDYMRPTFGSSYGDASGYGSRGGYDLGTHQRDVGPSYRGLGPQSYKRPDERIRDDVYERLTDSHHIDARNIAVEVNQGNVTLTGTVGQRRMRYMAEDLVEGVMGVANINNQLKVQSEPMSRPTDAPPTGDLPDNKRH